MLNSSTSSTRYTHADDDDLEVQQLCSVPENTELSHRFLIALLLLRPHTLLISSPSHSIRCTCSQIPPGPPGYHQYTAASTLHKHKPRTRKPVLERLVAGSLSRPIPPCFTRPLHLLQLLQQLSRASSIPRGSFDRSVRSALQPVWTTLPSRPVPSNLLTTLHRNGFSFTRTGDPIRGGSKNLFRLLLLLLLVVEVAELVSGSS